MSPVSNPAASTPIPCRRALPPEARGGLLDALALASLLLRRTRPGPRPTDDGHRSSGLAVSPRHLGPAGDVLAPDRRVAGAPGARLHQAPERAKAVRHPVRRAHHAARSGSAPRPALDDPRGGGAVVPAGRLPVRQAAARPAVAREPAVGRGARPEDAGRGPAPACGDTACPAARPP